MYYNKAEDRYGHVFQGRFRSEAVEDELIEMMKLIHEGE
jgi:hypothetical protein